MPFYSIPSRTIANGSFVSIWEMKKKTILFEEGRIKPWKKAYEALYGFPSMMV
jgi:hypothetical protein